MTFRANLPLLKCDKSKVFLRSDIFFTALDCLKKYLFIFKPEDEHPNFVKIAYSKTTY